MINSKKVIILYGNCHMQNLETLLQNIPEIHEKYEIYPLIGVCDIQSTKYFEQPVFRECDVFIHQSIRKNNRYGEEYASENVMRLLKKECKVISVPNVYHMPMCFFPQYEEMIELKHRRGYTMFFRDRIIEYGYRNKKKVSEIANMYYDTSYYSSTELNELWCSFIEKVKKREEEWDIKISDFLISNKGEVPLFYDPNHPTEVIIKYIANQVLQILDVKCENSSLEEIPVPRLDAYEMPICKSVSSFFGLEYDLNAVQLRQSGRKVYRERMGLENYIRQYEALIWQDKTLSNDLRIRSYFSYLRYSFLEFIRKITDKILSYE